MTDQGTLGQSEAPGQSSGVAKAFAAGRSAGLAIAALAAGVISFVSLLGAEKAVLAVVLGILAIRGAAPGSSARRLGILGILLGGLFVVTLVVLLAVLHDQFAKLVRLLHQLS